MPIPLALALVVTLSGSPEPGSNAPTKPGSIFQAASSERHPPRTAKKKGKKQRKETLEPELEAVPETDHEEDRGATGESAGGADRPAGFIGDTNSPGPYGEGYLSWGTTGGATLGVGDGLRANFFTGLLGTGNMSYLGVEAYYLLGLNEDLDVGFGGRLTVWFFGAAPGVRLRYRILQSGAFHLAFDAGAYAGFAFGILPIFTGRGLLVALGFIGFGSLEPGLAGSYFLRDNIELIFGLYVPVAVYGGPGLFGTVGFDLRVGGVYTLKQFNVGIFAQIDVIPGIGFFNSTRGLLTGFTFGGGFTGGMQYRF